jgi:hypothetical protein
MFDHKYEVGIASCHTSLGWFYDTMISINLMLKTYISSLFESVEFGPKINCQTHNNHMGGCQTHQQPLTKPFKKLKDNRGG